MFWSREKCERLISYDGINLSLSGIEGSELINFNIGDFKIKKEILQAACDIAQIYDMYAYRNCQRIHQFEKKSPERSTFILEITKNEERLLEFLTIIKIASINPSEKIEKALADWIAHTFKRLRNDSPLIPDVVRAGDVVRESPPIEEYNNLKRNIIIAKKNYPYLIKASENPSFDINKIYLLSRNNKN
jgi:hypothetical protein